LAASFVQNHPNEQPQKVIAIGQIVLTTPLTEENELKRMLDDVVGPDPPLSVGAIVVRDLPANVVAVGNPTRVIRL
jgi:hypothetical protein